MKTRQTLRDIAARFPSLEPHLPPPVTRNGKYSPSDDNPHVIAWVLKNYDPETGQSLKGWVTGGGRHALAFVLHVWNSDNPFSVGHAFGVWDERHRAAFAAWVDDPATF